MKFCLPSVLSRARGIAALCAVATVLCSLCLAAKEFVKPTAKAANSYPAHDEHPTERTAVAVDPYDMPDKAQIFSVNYRDEGFVPIFLVITNNGDQPISLGQMKAELVTSGRTKISPASTDDLYRRLSHPARTDARSPLPFPRSKVKGAVSKQAMDEINSAQFSARAVEPHATQSGFLFFDVSGISTPLAGATFYLTDVQDSGGNELMFFEIPLEKYLSAPPAKETSQ